VGSAISDNRVSSLSAAWTLLALDAYAKAASAEGKLGIVEIAGDGRERALPVPPGAMPRSDISTNAAKLRFTKEGALGAYYSVDQSGFDRVLPPAGVYQGVEVFHEFLDLQGNVISKAKVGEEFLVRVRLRPTKRDRLSQIAVVDLLPGGTEAVLELRPSSDSSSAGADPASSPQSAAGTSALPIGLPEKSNWVPQHVDVRDDRLVLYGDIGKDVSTFVYRVRATNAGVFQSPPAFAEGMYDRKVAGMSQAGKLEIVKP
jgi:hypothetical protein